MAMKSRKIFKKNRLVILALSVMIGVAGYLNFSEDKKTTTSDDEIADAEVISYETDTENEYAEAESDEDVDEETGEVELNSDEEDIGEAVLTSSKVTSGYISTAKLNREQNRSKSREALLEIINDETIDETSKEDAVASYVALNDIIEMESDIETLLLAKGFSEAIVTIGDNYVDVALNVESVDDTTRAQIEDVITRKTGRDVSEVVISVAGEK